MKAITLYQPWATLVALGEKKFETRHWGTPYRGLLAIHAAKRPVDYRTISREIDSILANHRLRWLDLPRGAVLAVVRLTSIRHALDIRIGMAGDQRRQLALGDFSRGRYAWELELVHAFSEPIPARGYQRFWQWDPPDEFKQQYKEFKE